MNEGDNYEQQNVACWVRPQNPDIDVEEFFDQAVLCHQAGDLSQAEKMYRLILQTDPRHSDALHSLGTIAHQLGRNEIAVELIESAIEIKSDAAMYYSNLGNALHGLGRFKDAIAAYDSALIIRPNYAEAHFNRGVVLGNLGCREDAAIAYRSALMYKTDYSDAYFNLGSVLSDSGNLNQAIVAYAATVVLTPDLTKAYFNQAYVLKELGRLNRAANVYKIALRLQPDLIQAHTNLGNLLIELGCFIESISAHAKVLCMKPDFIQAYLNLGASLKGAARFGPAIVLYTNALRISPENADLWFSLGTVLTESGRIDEAIVAYNNTLSVDPDYDYAYSSYLFCLGYKPGISEQNLFEKAREFYARQVPVRPILRSLNDRDPNRRMRIGYVSADFRIHPVGYFLSQVLNHHDTSQVEVFCYSNSPVVDEQTRQLQTASNHWRNIFGVSDEAAAKKIMDDDIDILIDLAGHTSLNRLRLFELRPAPIQVTWMGYGGTTGLSSIDYILADRFVVPEESAPYFSELIWRLPKFYMCFPRPGFECHVSSPPLKDVGAVTFGCFNNHAKTSPLTIAIWSRILNDIPGSRLLLKTRAYADLTSRTRILDQFAEFGIGADQLILEDGPKGREGVLLAYNRVDIALDPTPYGGATTTAEALWMGVPVITLLGATWVGRMSTSILLNVGLPELIAKSVDEYVEIAVKLAANTDRIQILRANLRSWLESSLCDGQGFTRDLEYAYRCMWQTHVARKSFR